MTLDPDISGPNVTFSQPFFEEYPRYFPYVENLMPMIKYLGEKMGFNDNLVKALCTFVASWVITLKHNNEEL